ncbi:MAG: tetratricopeptide repeat protein [bacterium]
MLRNCKYIIPFLIILVLKCSTGGTTEYREASNLQKQGKYEDAIRIYENLIDEYDNRGIGLLAKKGVDECKATIAYQQAIYEINLGDRKMAEKLLTEADKLHYLSSESQYIKAMGRFIDGDVDGSERMFLRIIQDNPALPYGYMGLGRVDEEFQRYTSAILNYSKALKLIKEDKLRDIIYSGIERCIEVNLDNNVIMEISEDTVNRYGANPKINYYLGKYYLSKEKPECNKAISYFSRALSSGKSNNDLLRNIYIGLARAYEYEDYHDKALKYIDEALKIEPDKDLIQWKKSIEYIKK